MPTDADVIVVGAGLAGLVATAELADAGRRVILLDQEPEASLGGQAFWSFGGLFLVDSPEQRRCRIRDSCELALQDWMGTAGFERLAVSGNSRVPAPPPRMIAIVSLVIVCIGGCASQAPVVAQVVAAAGEALGARTRVTGWPHSRRARSMSELLV